MDIGTRHYSVSTVGGPQSVPSRISVVLVEETEVRCAERLATAPEDKEVRLLAGVACPAGETICGNCIAMPGRCPHLTGPVGTLSPSDSYSVGPVGPDGTLSSSDLAGILFPAVPAGIPIPVDAVGPVGPDGMLSSSDLVGILFSAVPAGIPFPAGPVGPVGRDGTLSSSDPAGMLFPAIPAGMLIPAGPVDPVGPDGTLSSSNHAGILFSAVPAGIPFPAGPVGTLSPSDFGYVGPVGPVGTLSLSDHVGVLSLTVPVGVLSLVDPDDETPAGLVQAVRTEFPDWQDPVVKQLPAALPVWDPGNVGDVDMTMDVRQAVPNVIDRRAVVAMVGIRTARMGEDAPMDCDSDCDCEEWVFSMSDLYDSDWVYPRDLAYADWCDFNTPEEYGVDLPDREDTGLPKAVDVSVMMVCEVASPGYERQELSSCSLPVADVVIAEPVADVLIVGQNVPVVTESQDHMNTFDLDILNTFETVGGMPVYYGGDLNDSDCESVDCESIMI